MSVQLPATLWMTAAANGNPTSDGMLRTLLEDAGMELAADAPNGPDGVAQASRYGPTWY